MMHGRRALPLRLIGLVACLCLGAGAIIWARRSPSPDAEPPPPAALSSEPDAEALARALGELVAAGDWEASNELEAELAAAGEAAVPVLVAILEEGTNAPVVLRQRAAWVLGEIGNPAATAALAAAVDREPAAEVRGQIILALSGVTGRSGGAARSVLQAVLSSADEEPDIRSSAALLLAKRPEAEATAFLVGAARRREDPEVTRWAVEALGFSPHAEAASPLLREFARTEEDETLRAGAVRSLARLEGERSLDLLGDLVRSEGSAEVRRVCVSALEEMGPAGGSLPLLEEALAGDEDQGVRALAARALGRPGLTEALPVLENALSAEEALYVRLKLVEAIGRVGGERAEAILMRIAEAHESVPVRGAARAALRELRGEGAPRGMPLREEGQGEADTF